MSGIDVLVVGGGPAGSATAALLAQSGLAVTLCDRERFPRFHVGESLLPQSAPLLRRLGVWEQLLGAAFQRKWGAHFLFEPEGSGSNVVFARGLDRRNPMSFQVRRAEFDHLLLRNAAARGVEVREGVTVEEVRFDGERAVGARVLDAAGVRAELAARVVIDATGRDAFLGGQLGLRERDPALRQIAMFSHYRGARMGLGRDGGDILVVGGPVGWYWMIPLDEQTTSVGVVYPGRIAAERRGRSLDDFFADLVSRSPEVRSRLAGAERTEPVHPLADFSYRLRRFAGDGWATVGDAACFLDPVFSSGVHVALSTGVRVADDVARALRRKGRLDAADLASYERWARRGLDHFRRYILGWYTPEFVEVFTGRPPLELLRAGVSTALAGRAFSRGLGQRLLEGVFFSLVAVERRRIRSGRLAAPTAPAVDWVGDGPAATSS
jgi:flavin-dependent dehydrogenase